MADNQPLNVGEAAPDFELMNQDKNKVKLSDYRGKKKVMLLFYPMDFSPVCTQEHCTFGPAFDKLNGPDADTVVFGVSCDSPFTHAAFRKQYNIPYDLLADTSRKMVKAYGMFAGGVFDLLGLASSREVACRSGTRGNHPPSPSGRGHG